jgi:hypothetical protein
LCARAGAKLFMGANELLMEKIMIWVRILMFLSAELSFLERTGVQICSFNKICSFCIDIQSPLVKNCVLVLVQNYLWVQIEITCAENYDLGANPDVPVC